MATATDEGTGARRSSRRRGEIRIEEAIRAALKVRAAVEGKYMEQWLHELLCRELGRPELLEMPPSKSRRKG